MTWDVPVGTGLRTARRLPGRASALLHRSQDLPSRLSDVHPSDVFLSPRRLCADSWAPRLPHRSTAIEHLPACARGTKEGGGGRRRRRSQEARERVAWASESCPPSLGGANGRVADGGARVFAGQRDEERGAVADSRLAADGPAERLHAFSHDREAEADP
jgi:hypothetical protein